MSSRGRRGRPSPSSEPSSSEERDELAHGPDLGGSPMRSRKSSSEQLNAVRRARAQLSLARTELRSSVEFGEQLELGLEALETLELELQEIEEQLEDEA